MKRSLKTIASQLTEADIQELMRLKRTGGKKVVSLQKKRDKLAADLAKVEAQLAQLTGEEAPKARRGRKPGSGKTAGRKPAVRKKAAAPAAAKGKKKVAGKRGGKINLTATVRDIINQAGSPQRARDIVEALPGKGVKVKDTADMRKRISVVLASQKNSFEQVSRGMYQVKS